MVRKVCASVAILTLVGATSCGGPQRIHPAMTLEEYVDYDDGVFRWEVVSSGESDEAMFYVVDMTSQTWRYEDEVDDTKWKHRLTIVAPKASPARHSETGKRTALLVIGGGSNNREPPEGPDERSLALAKATGAVIVALSNVPYQPLLFADGERPRYEDDLIAHTWNKYMETGDRTWLARWPMVKSAVRAMDATTALFAREFAGERTIDRFVVAGGSKRGWTTWLTGAIDKRVVAIIPIVIDVVNVIPSMEHHYAAYGFWAPAIGDYVNNGITKKRGTREYEKLISLVDPYFYLDRLKLPKYIINGTGDQFFLPDSSRFYFDQLPGEKYLRYVPNGDHGLGGTDAVESIASYLTTIVTDAPRPRFEWSFEDDGSIRVVSESKPAEVRLWRATNPERRDFRKERIGDAYMSHVLEAGDGGVYVGNVPKPPKGWTAYFVELTYPSFGGIPLKFTTGVRVVPDTLPYAGTLDNGEGGRLEPGT